MSYGGLVEAVPRQQQLALKTRYSITGKTKQDKQTRYSKQDNGRYSKQDYMM